MVDIRDVRKGMHLLLRPISTMFYVPSCINSIGIVDSVSIDKNKITMIFESTFDNSGLEQWVLPYDVEWLESREIGVGNLNIKDLF